jgi:ABC-type amino acid transport substrate-binding protein
MKNKLCSASSGARVLGFGVLGLMSMVSVLAAPLKIETIDVAPFGFLGTDGKPTGMWLEIGNLIADEAKLPHENVLTPFARTAQDMGDGTGSFTIRFTNEQLEQNSIPVATIVSLPTIVVGVKGSDFSQLADLHGKTVGLLRGSKNFSDDLITKFEANDYGQEVKMLVGQHLDGISGSAIGIYYQARQCGLTQDQLGKPLVLGAQDVLLLISKKTADDSTVAALKAAVDRLQKQDAFTKVINKYMGDFKWAVTDAQK